MDVFCNIVFCLWLILYCIVYDVCNYWKIMLLNWNPLIFRSNFYFPLVQPSDNLNLNNVPYSLWTCFRDKYSWNFTHLKHSISASYLGMSDRSLHIKENLQKLARSNSLSQQCPIMKQNCPTPLFPFPCVN